MANSSYLEMLRKGSTKEPAEMVQVARSLTMLDRKQILMSFSETELHQHLKKLFLRMEPNSTVEVTHGGFIAGDTVVVRTDTLNTITIIVKKGDLYEKERDFGRLIVRAKYILDPAYIVREIYKHNKSICDKIDKFVKPSHGIVAVFGWLDPCARKSLISELGNTVVIRDLEWFVEAFTNHYPQIFLEASAVDFLREHKITSRAMRRQKAKESTKTAFLHIVPLFVAGISYYALQSWPSYPDHFWYDMLVIPLNYLVASVVFAVVAGATVGMEKGLFVTIIFRDTFDENLEYNIYIVTVVLLIFVIVIMDPGSQKIFNDIFTFLLGLFFMSIVYGIAIGILFGFAFHIFLFVFSGFSTRKFDPDIFK